LIRAAAAKHGLDETLITRLIAAESNFNPKAVSRKQALGLMQLLPKTAAQYSVADVFDPSAEYRGRRPLFEGFAREIPRKCRLRSLLTMRGPTWWSDMAEFRRSRKRRIT
jgi:hypothetical protein